MLDLRCTLRSFGMLITIHRGVKAKMQFIVLVMSLKKVDPYKASMSID